MIPTTPHVYVRLIGVAIGSAQDRLDAAISDMEEQPNNMQPINSSETRSGRVPCADLGKLLVCRTILTQAMDEIASLEEWQTIEVTK